MRVCHNKVCRLFKMIGTGTKSAMGENSEWNDREKLLPRLSSKGIKMLRSGNRKQVRPQIGPLIGQKNRAIAGPVFKIFSDRLGL